jgi:hypothetical protein
LNTFSIEIQTLKFFFFKVKNSTDFTEDLGKFTDTPQNPSVKLPIVSVKRHRVSTKIF